MKYLLDTHILLWWYQDSPDLPKPYQTILNDSERKEERLGISVISLWEIAKLANVGKLHVTFSLDHWFAELEEDAIIQVLPLGGSIILESTRLGDRFHKDPADQLIVATARFHNLRLLTVDERIGQSGAVLVERV